MRSFIRCWRLSSRLKGLGAEVGELGDPIGSNPIVSNDMPVQVRLSALRLFFSHSISGGHTMKTLRTKDGSIVRVSNSKAAKEVDSGEATYCPKSEWKKLRPDTNPTTK
jgi:hypothetical protein